MQVSPSTDSSYYQNDKKKATSSSSEYLHVAIALNESDKIVEFRDKSTDKKVQIALDQSMYEKLKQKFSDDFDANDDTVQAGSDLESYMQKMWSKYENDANTDTNHDGYLDASELLNSKRVVNIDVNEKDHSATLNFASFAEAYGDKALDEINKFFLDNGISDGKLSIDQDFNALLSEDMDLDANSSNKEVLLALSAQVEQTESLGIDTKDILLRMIAQWSDEKKIEGLNELAGETLYAKELEQKAYLTKKRLDEEGNPLKDKNLPDWIYERAKEAFSTSEDIYARDENSGLVNDHTFSGQGWFMTFVTLNAISMSGGQEEMKIDEENVNWEEVFKVTAAEFEKNMDSSHTNEMAQKYEKNLNSPASPYFFYSDEQKRGMVEQFKSDNYKLNSESFNLAKSILSELQAKS